jgi:hypothetical protein
MSSGMGPETGIGTPVFQKGDPFFARQGSDPASRISLERRALEEAGKGAKSGFVT